MTEYNDIPVYSMQDIMDTLENYENSDDVLSFVSDLTGVSVDKLLESIADKDFDVSKNIEREE